MKSAVVVLAVIAVVFVAQSEAQEFEPKSSFQKAALARHNFFRRNHGVHPLTIKPKLTHIAQKWADVLAKADEPFLRHNPDTQNKYGENVFKTSRNYKNKDHLLGDEVVDNWYGEVKSYTDYNNEPLISGHPPLKDIGHFTQVVWNDTQVVGVAKATARSGNTYVVANYWPPGNYPGRFVANVFPPKA